MFEQREDSGSLFKNLKKNSEKSPDYTGNGNYRGETFRIAGWIKTSRDGSKTFLSLKFSEPRDVDRSAPKDESEIPF
jgi:uncharacterized protein (DUF736 family)